MHEQEYFGELARRPEDFPISQKAADETLPVCTVDCGVRRFACHFSLFG